MIDRQKIDKWNKIQTNEQLGYLIHLNYMHVNAHTANNILIFLSN